MQSTQPLQTAEKRPLTPEVLEQQLGRLGGTGFRLASCECRLPEGLMLPLSILNQTRRALVEQIQTVRQEREASVPTRLPEPFVLPALPAGAATPDAPPHLSVLCRRPEQIPSVLDAGADAVYLDFEDLRDYAAGVEAVRRHTKSIPVFLATPRIQKPSETGYFKLMERAEPDGVLIRNLGAAQYFRHSPLHRIGDFSLNVANPYSAAILKERGNLDYLTISYDLNAGQVEDLLRAAPPEWFELTLHQHMPMFHMEHCVFCTFLSDGSSYKNCGRPCERYHVQLRDRVGQLHPLLADAGCRNTLFNGRAQTGAGFSGVSAIRAFPASAWNCWTILRKKHAFWYPATGNCWTAPALRPGSSGNWTSRNSSAPRKARSGPDNASPGLARRKADKECTARALKRRKNRLMMASMGMEDSFPGTSAR